MRIERYPYRASAWSEGGLVAQSDSCLCLAEPGQTPVLFFPLADIDLERLESEGGRHAVGEPPAAGGALAGFGAFNQDQVRIEISDGRQGDAPRDVTIKRFPTWGDAAHLIDQLDVRPDGGISFVGVARSDGRRPVVEGSQMLGQAIVAAGRHAAGRRVVSSSMIFLRSADARQPLRFELEELSSGRILP